jgi:hypothetical protein
MQPNSRSSNCRPLLLAIVLCVAAAPASAQSRPTDALAWLSGCWEQRVPNGVVEEQWSSSAGGMLLGFSRTVRRDTVREFEFVRIYSIGDTLVYDAQPSRQARAEFRAVGPFEPEVVFANPAHDFPQRIRYRRVGSDSLVARIEGTRNGQPRGIDFPYRRVRCG